jgi:hypothetical protein
VEGGERAVVAARTREAPLKIDEETNELVSTMALFLHMTKKDLVAEAVRVYGDIRRKEIQAEMRAAMRKLDGTRAARVAMLAGITVEELNAVGGVRETG